MMKSVDVAVVGGGVAGLIAAHDTARMGLATVIFEAGPACGGRARTRVQEGFHFNQGPHALYVYGQFRKALDALRVNVSGHRPQFRAAIRSEIRPCLSRSMPCTRARMAAVR